MRDCELKNDALLYSLYEYIGERYVVDKPYTIEAVSYTHLDVYKRQLQARVKSQLRRYMKLGGGTVRPDTIVIGGIELNDVTKDV